MRTGALQARRHVRYAGTRAPQPVRVDGHVFAVGRAPSQACQEHPYRSYPCTTALELLNSPHQDGRCPLFLLRCSGHLRVEHHGVVGVHPPWHLPQRDILGRSFHADVRTRNPDLCRYRQLMGTRLTCMQIPLLPDVRYPLNACQNPGVGLKSADFQLRQG